MTVTTFWLVWCYFMGLNLIVERRVKAASKGSAYYTLLDRTHRNPKQKHWRGNVRWYKGDFSQGRR